MDTDASRLSGALADRYRVERELGSGGMATVYLARDVRHDREVAIKVLRADIAAAIGVDRFLAEIKTTAHLQHPNILGLIDSGEVNGSVFYVMPFVRGGSLRARLEREQQLPVADAVRIATQVANALQYAHKSGVIHRDIKPENILLHEEQALVADFGIALAVTRSQSGKRVTEAGTSLGTPEYMSPEQAMGERTLDARADIYALGCVLYEMLAGEPPFRGPSAQAVIAKVMTVEPERISALRKSVPRNVAAATMMALQKVPADRFANAAEFAAALGNPQFVAPALGDRTVQTSAVMERRNVGMVAAIGVLAIVGAFGWLRQTGTPTNPVVRFEIASDPTMGGQVTLSHDGSRLLWSAGNAYWERRLDTLGSHRLRDAAMPQSGIRDIDKNGRDVLLSGRGGLAIASLAAGPARVITGGGVGRGGAALGFDRYVYVSANQSHAIARVPRDSGAVEVLADAPDSTTIMEIVALPGGHGLIASLSKNGIPSIAAFDLGAKTWKPLGSGGPQIRFVPPEYVLFASGSYLMAAAIDTKSLAFRQPAVPYVEASSDISMLATSATVLAYRAGLDVGDVGIEVRTLGGTAPRTLANVSDSLRFSSFSVSPDGRRFAATGTPIPTPGSSVQAVSNIWVYELPAGPMSRLPSSLRANYPAWMPGGKDISYAQFSADTPFTSALMRRSFDGLTTPVTIVTRTADSGLVACASWFPTGGRALIQVGGGGCGGLQGRGGGGGGGGGGGRGPGGPPDGRGQQPGRGRGGRGGPGRGGFPQGPSGDVMLLSLAAPNALTRVIATDSAEQGPAVNPNGKLFAYVSTANGVTQVYVSPVDGSTRRQASLNVGGVPRWSHDGRTLFYAVSGQAIDSDTLFAAQVSGTGADLVVSDIHPVLTGINLRGGYSVMPGDSSFVMRASATGDVRNLPPITIVLNFVQELKKLFSDPAAR